MKKYICEAIGTAVLVLFGCGTAVITGNAVATALAFGLAIIAMAYAIGNISGCHVNPAVSFAMLINKKMSVKDFIFYVLAQILGAFIGVGILFFALKSSGVVQEFSKQAMLLSGETVTKQGIAAIGLGTNSFGIISTLNISMIAALVIEIILTFVFVYTILGVTSDEKKSTIAGIVIGLALTFVHILGINFTGTSVNPARSLAPATLMAIIGETDALKQVWVFIVAPFIGSALAAFTFKFLNKETK